VNQRYEYRFVRLGEGWFSVRKSGASQYREEVDRHARDGWRLVQIFAPGLGVYGSAKFFELVFERPVGGAVREP
jgi:hypothetical protein